MNSKHVILVVDDDEDLRAILAQVLRSAGYHAEEAASAEAAFRAMEQSAVRPCLVLTDIQLAGMTGFDLRMRMRAHPRLRKIPVLFMTGGVQDFGATLAETSSWVLQKPISRSALCSAVEGRSGGPGCGDHTVAASPGCRQSLA